VYYQRPVITNIVMPIDSSVVCTSVSLRCPSIDVLPGIVPTTGAQVIIIGNNLGVDTDMNSFMFRWQSDEANFVDDLHYRDTSGLFTGACSAHSHTSVKCTLPPAQGKGFTLFVEIAGQTPTAGAWPGSGKSVTYAPPTIYSAAASNGNPAGLVPNNGPTLNPGTIAVNGKNFGLTQPSMTIGGKECIVQLKANPATGYHNTFDCIVANGEGANLAAVVTAAGQLSSTTNSATFSYNAPTLTSFTPTSAPTSGQTRTTGEPIVMIITGTDFGTSTNSNSEVVFRTKLETPTKEFIVPSTSFISRSHTELTFHIPEGFGASVEVLVRVHGQTSLAISQKFVYEAPIVDNIAPKCGSFDCYGFKNPGEFFFFLFSLFFFSSLLFSPMFLGCFSS
jgi:hypothetical protein